MNFMDFSQIILWFLTFSFISFQVYVKSVFDSGVDFVDPKRVDRREIFPPFKLVGLQANNHHI